MASFLAGLGGAADQVLQGMNADRDAETKERQMRLASSLETEKAQTLAMFAERLKAAPLDRLQGRAQAYANQSVPQEAQPVKSLSGTYATEAGPSNGGFTGDVGIIQRAISQMPEGSEKDAALAQFKSQSAQAGSANAAAVEGQTRKRTSEEAFDLALSDSKASDLQAYAAGRGLASDKTVTVPEGATVIDRSGKVLYSSSDTKGEREREREDRRDARASAAEEARDARQQKALDARERLAELRQGTGDSKITKEERLRFTSLFNDAGRQMRGIQDTISRLRRDPLYSMAKPGSAQYSELDDLRKQRAQYEDERKMYGSLLANGGAAPDAGSASTPQQETQGGSADRPPLSSFMKK